jgi:hypothetical protein
MLVPPLLGDQNRAKISLVILPEALLIWFKVPQCCKVQALSQNQYMVVIQMTLKEY